MKVETTRFGAVDIAEDRFITFSDGLPGFPGKRYVLLHDERNELVQWLQSAEDPDVALLLMDPLVLRADYAVTPKPDELRPIEPGDAPEDNVVCRVIVRSAERPQELYVNFFGPVLFNVERRLAMQLPLVGSAYGVREIWPEPPEKTRAAEPSAPPAPAPKGATPAR